MLQSSAARAEVDHAFLAMLFNESLRVAAELIYRRTGTVDILALENSSGLARLNHQFFIRAHRFRILGPRPKFIRGAVPQWGRSSMRAVPGINRPLPLPQEAPPEHRRRWWGPLDERRTTYFQSGVQQRSRRPDRTVSPTRAGFKPSNSMNRNSSLRCAPSAMRIPISFVRCVTT